MRISKLILLLIIFFLSHVSFGQSAIRVNKENLQNFLSFDNDLFETSPLYREILSYLNEHEEEIKKRQLGHISNGKNFDLWGGLNHVGLNFSKNFGNFSIVLKREVAPDLFDDERWIITDTFDVVIDISQTLKDLKSHEVIEISEKNLAAFVGLNFIRSFKHIHFAHSYEEGLTLNLNKLFMNIKNFQGVETLNIEAGEILERSDSFLLTTGAFGNLPLASGLSLSAGLLGKRQILSRLLIHGVLEDEKSFANEQVRISYEKSNKNKLSLSARLIADLFKVFQVTLFKYDFEYQFTDSKVLHLSLSDSDVYEIQEDIELFNEFKKLLGQKRISTQIFRPFVVSEERRREELKKMKYQVLVYGGHKDVSTEHIQISNGNKTKAFFRHNFIKEKFREGVFNHFFKILAKSFLRVETILKKVVKESNGVRLDYQNERNLLKSKGDLNLNAQEPNLSINFKKEYSAQKLSKRERSKVVELIDDFSGADPLLANNILKGHIKSNINFYSNFSMGHDAMIFFHDLSIKEVHRIINDACKVSRRGLVGFFDRLLRKCERGLKEKYDLYTTEWSTNDYTYNTYQECKNIFEKNNRGRIKNWLYKRKFIKSCIRRKSQKSKNQKEKEIPLWRLTKFFQEIQKRIPSKVYYYRLFGLRNVHVSGHFEGMDRKGHVLFHHFDEGNFKGDSIVTNYLKNHKN